MLTGDLSSVRQCFVDSKMFGNWGDERRAKLFYEESIDEMKDADRLIERILYLEGPPTARAASARFVSVSRRWRI